MASIQDFPVELVEQICVQLYPDHVVGIKNSLNDQIDHYYCLSSARATRRVKLNGIRSFAATCKGFYYVAFPFLHDTVEIEGGTRLMEFLRVLQRNPVRIRATKALIINLTEGVAELTDMEKATFTQGIDDSSYIANLPLIEQEAAAAGLSIPRDVPRDMDEMTPMIGRRFGSLGFITAVLLNKLSDLRDLTIVAPPETWELMMKTLQSLDHPRIPSLRSVTLRRDKEKWSGPTYGIASHRRITHVDYTPLFELLPLAPGISTLSVHDMVRFNTQAATFKHLTTMSLNRVYVLPAQLWDMLSDCRLVKFTYIDGGDWGSIKVDHIIECLENSAKSLITLHIGVTDGTDFPFAEGSESVAKFTNLKNFQLDCGQMLCRNVTGQASRLIQTLPASLERLHMRGVPGWPESHGEFFGDRLAASVVEGRLPALREIAASWLDEGPFVSRGIKVLRNVDKFTAHW